MQAEKWRTAQFLKNKNAGAARNVIKLMKLMAKTAQKDLVHFKNGRGFFSLCPLIPVSNIHNLSRIQHNACYGMFSSNASTTLPLPHPYCFASLSSFAFASALKYILQFPEQARTSLTFINWSVFQGLTSNICRSIYKRGKLSF